MQKILLQPVQSVAITILADNLFDGLLPTQGVAKRPSLGGKTLSVPVATMEGGKPLKVFRPSMDLVHLSHSPSGNIHTESSLIRVQHRMVSLKICAY